MNKEEINVDEVIRTIQFSEIAQKGYKVMSNDGFDRIVNGVLNLQQENQQLKEKYLNAVADYETTKSENQQLHNKMDEISNFIKENKIKRYRPIEGEEYDEEILLDEDDITCLERIINDEYDYENR